MRVGVTCGASFTLLSTVVPFVQESWRKDLGEGGREGGREWKEGGREGMNKNINYYNMCLSWRKGAGFNFGIVGV